MNASPDIKIFLIGNKSDLDDERMILKETGENFKNDFQLDFFMETSAKTGINTKELFVEAAKLLYTDFCKYKAIKNLNGEEEQLRPKKLSKSLKKKKKCC